MRMNSRRAAMLVLVLYSAASGAALAHHILGIPHYAYDESYPQTPVLTYHLLKGPFEIKMTGFPGKPVPGEPCALSVYIQYRENRKPFDGKVMLTLRQVNMFGDDTLVYGPIVSLLTDSVYKFAPIFKAEANYIVRVRFQENDVPWTIDLPMVAGEPGSPWVVAGSVAGGVILFLIIIRAVRIKRKRSSQILTEKQRHAVAAD